MEYIFRKVSISLIQDNDDMFWKTGEKRVEGLQRDGRSGWIIRIADED